MLVLRSVGFEKNNHISWSGRGVGGPPLKILKPKKSGEAISGHFVGAFLPSVNEEFQRMLPHLYCMLFLNKDNENYAYICISLVCVQISLFRFENPSHLHLKISTFHPS